MYLRTYLDYVWLCYGLSVCKVQNDYFFAFSWRILHCGCLAYFTYFTNLTLKTVRKRRRKKHLPIDPLTHFFFLWTAICDCQQVQNSWLSLKVSFAHIFTNLTQKYLCIFDSQFYPWRQFIWPNSLHHHKSMRVQFALQNCWKMVFCYFYHSHIILFEGK